MSDATETPTAQSLHPGGRYYPGPPHTNPPGYDMPSSSNEPNNPVDGIGISKDSRPTEEGTSDHLGSSSFGYGDTNELYEGLLPSQGLVDRRSVPTCFLGRELEAHFLH
ncbi:peroxin-20 [Penicillium crustosum]|uniref:peroxin-20 n=1 Tax=Penicillium crustosum TaxID=36656 RepID=UPI0023A2B45A|nr:peroxin-20 [Penicillium crustosum]KAJ5402949.1 peroxin-20 [Penicillium crustosum]